MHIMSFPNKPFIVAELGASHLGSQMRALAICEAAKKAGADAVKLQTFTPEQMVGDPNYIIPGGPWHGRRLLSLYEEAHTPREWHDVIFGYCRHIGIECFSTPFHPDDVAFLETLDCPIYKISSFEINDHELIKACANTGKPLIISTGMASVGEIAWAVESFYVNGGSDVTVLKCTSAYPASAEDANLRAMKDMRSSRWSCDLGNVGISDHTPGIGVAIAAAALGAAVIEKHLTLCRADGGPDAAFSMEPDEFAQMVTECRRAVSALGKTRYGPHKSESASVELRRSLWFSKPLQQGEIITREHLKSARPALGLSPSLIEQVIGKRAARNVNHGEPVTYGTFED